MAITKTNFGNTKDGKAITLYSIENKNGAKLEVMDFGAIMVRLFMPDRDGKLEDIVLGYDTPEGYFTNGCFFGATIGPSANRLDNASFTIDGVKYQLTANDLVTNNLHSHDDLGYHKRMWDAQITDNSVIFSLEDADGTMGFPGNKKVQVTYTLTDDNEVKIDYFVTTDKKTLINMTNHAYYNLQGQASGKNIENHKLWIKAFHYTPVYERLIPTGDLVPVKGTAFDFTVMKPVGQDIEPKEDARDKEQLTYGQGYDHDFVIDDCTGELQLVAAVEEPVSGRKMEVYTDQPAIQFYAGNCVPEQTGKAGAKYGKRSGLCLETQSVPNSVNERAFDGINDVIFTPERPYKTSTVYKFSVI